MILLYCNIGAMIDIRQKELGCGAKVIDKLSLAILTEFPNMSGFPTRNLKLMVQFYKEYANAEIVQLPVAQIFHVFIKNIQGYVKKMAKSLHIVDDMSKKMRNFDVFDEKNKF